MSAINLSSFDADARTVSATVGKEARTVPAQRLPCGSLVAYGFLVRFPPGAKAWPASVRVSPAGVEHVVSVRANNAGRTATPRPVGFNNDVKFF